jgi:hypothetical protein
VPYTWLQIALDRLRGIEPSEVLQALRATHRRPVAASHAGIRVLTVWARTDAGRPLIVVLRPVGGFDYEIIGASAMTDDQAHEFTQWEAHG